jgi:hypothetical protein
MNEIIKCDEQIMRERNIDKLLTKFIEKDVPDNIIHHINKKYPETKLLNFLRTEQLELGFFIKMISLDFKSISSGIIVGIKSNSSQQFGSILLKSGDDIYWRIKPDNYYIFQIEKYSKRSYNMREELKKIEKNINKDNKKDMKQNNKQNNKKEKSIKK